MLGTLQGALAIVIVLGLVIFVHELGHFLAAKWAGVYAPRFSIGFGPALWRRRWGETEYVLAAVPLGGYVRMASREDETMALLEGGGERSPGAPETVGGSGAQVVPDADLPPHRIRGRDWDPDALAPFGPNPVPHDRLFESKPLVKRLVIMIAGVTMNFVLGFLVLTALAIQLGRPIIRTRVVGDVAPVAGGVVLRDRLSPGDTILAVDGRPVATWDAIAAAITAPDSSSELMLQTHRGAVVIPVGGAGQPSREQVARALTPYFAPVIDQVVQASPAARGGLRPGDSVIAVDGVAVRTWSDLVDRIQAAPGRALAFEVSRAGERRTLTLRPDSVVQRDPQTGERRYIGQIGTTPRIPDERVPVSFAQAIETGWRATWRTAGEVIRTVKGLVTRDVALNQLGGPIAIARASVTAARTGVADLMYLVALLSINVGILNLLPIPILDGGQIVLNVLEAARGGTFSLRTREYIMRFGLLAIALLFVLVMFNDIKREVETLLQRFN